MPHIQSLQSLRASLAELRGNRLAIPAFCRQWREQSPLLDALPARYRQVMEDLLGRMESGSLFTEESCSFSQEDLQSNLAAWLDKAEQTVQAA
jgi:hypothetical protein